MDDIKQESKRENVKRESVKWEETARQKRRGRWSMAIAMLAAAVATTPAPALARYPDKPVHIIVGFTPGGSTDAVARLMAAKLGERLGQSFIVENKPGANGNIATEYTQRSPADGYTLYYTSIGFVTNPLMYKTARYDPAHDFTAIGQIMSAPNVLVVPANSPYQNMKQLIADGKARPGALNFASSGTGTSVHLSGELFAALSGLDVVHIPYKGSGSFMSDLIAGRMTMAFPNLPTALPLIKGGQLRALGVTTRTRSGAAPDIPSIEEAGLPGYDMSTWYGLVGPKDLPADVVATLSDALLKTLDDPDFKDKLLLSGADPKGSTPAQFQQFINQQTTAWKGVLAKMKVEAN
ncbi:tripartite tricarboxylate transporter substrate binding protein [Achromobacter aloeverae]|nr:tripartite tricarboxylate transporter substrate binding protein [Achromobacter aloeverae]